MSTRNIVESLPKNMSDEISTSKIAENLERRMNLHSGATYNLRDHAQTIGHAEVLPEGLVYNDRPIRGDKITTKGRLAESERAVARTKEKLTAAEEKLAKYSDTKKGQGLAAKRDVESLKRTLEAQGKDAQRYIYDTKEGLERYKDRMAEAHTRVMEDLSKHKESLHDAISDIAHDADTKGISKFQGLGDHTVEVRVGRDKYQLSSDGIKKNGAAVSTLEAHELSDIQQAARQTVSDTVGAHEDLLERAHSNSKGIVEEKIAHLEGMKSEVSTKTGIGEWTGSKASAMTAGGAKAGGIMNAAQYEKATSFGKFKAETKANFGSQGKTGVKFLRGALTALGVIGVLDAGKKIGRGLGVFSKTDEAGKEVPPGAGDLMMGIGEGALSLGGIYLALTHGGKGKITGR